MRKTFLLPILAFIGLAATCQKVDSIFVNLYTDSLKKGTYNYINVDGLLSNGRYLPLDTSHLLFKASDGVFFGNCLKLPADFAKEKVDITISLRSDPKVSRSFTMYVKKKVDGQLRTEQEVMDDIKRKTKVKSKVRLI
jgi:hypothetical protein